MGDIASGHPDRRIRACESFPHELAVYSAGRMLVILLPERRIES